MDHDRLFKELLTMFFTEFRQLFSPELAGYSIRTRWSSWTRTVHRRDAGRASRGGLVARARFRGQALCFLIQGPGEGRSQAGPASASQAAGRLGPCPGSGLKRYRPRQLNGSAKHCWTSAALTIWTRGCTHRAALIGMLRKTLAPDHTNPKRQRGNALFSLTLRVSVRSIPIKALFFNRPF